MARGKGVARHTCKCRECNGEFKATRSDAQFCGQQCRTDYTNRRRERGAKLYDLFMISRYDRTAAKRDNVWSLMCRMAEQWNAEDKADGRQAHYDFAHLAFNGQFTKYSYISKGRI